VVLVLLLLLLLLLEVLWLLLLEVLWLLLLAVERGGGLPHRGGRGGVGTLGGSLVVFAAAGVAGGRGAVAKRVLVVLLEFLRVLALLKVLLVLLDAAPAQCDPLPPHGGIGGGGNSRGVARLGHGVLVAGDRELTGGEIPGVAVPEVPPDGRQGGEVPATAGDEAGVGLLLGVSPLVGTQVYRLPEPLAASWHLAGERTQVEVNQLVGAEVANGREGLEAVLALVGSLARVRPVVGLEVAGGAEHLPAAGNRAEVRLLDNDRGDTRRSKGHLGGFGVLGMLLFFSKVHLGGGRSRKNKKSTRRFSLATSNGKFVR